MRMLLLKSLWVLSGLCCLAAACGAGAAESRDLAGIWRFRIDRDDRGLAEEWHKAPLAGDATIRLPGTMQSQGFGDPISVETPWTGTIVDRSWFTAPEYEKYRRPGHFKVPFWLQPERYYKGAAWYQREIEVPAAWRGRRVVLTLERPHIETRAWLDDRELGVNNSLSTPHVRDLGTAVAPGKHRLTIRVDNRLVVDVGINSHSVTDHTQGNWNGIVGRIELSATPPVWVENLQVIPRDRRSIAVRCTIGNATGRDQQVFARLEFAAPENALGPPPGVRLVSLKGPRTTFTAQYHLGPEAPSWDEFHPALYRVTASVNGEPPSSRTASFGLREIGASGTQFVINGRKAFFRGTLECAVFPMTGHPPTDVASWRRIIGIAKDHGLNLFRFHSWCPPEAAFQAADELGFYFHVECASWANTSTALGQGKPIDRWLYEEADRILAAYGNHPSFVLMAYGNEPAGEDKTYLNAWVNHYRERDGRRLYTSAAGWPEIAANQFHVTPAPRIQAWGRARLADQRAAARNHHGLPRVRPGARGPGHQPRDRPVVRLSRPRHGPGLYRAAQAEELRDLPRVARGARDGIAGPRLPDRIRRASGPLLQGRDRVGAADPGDGRLRTPGPVRLSRSGDRACRGARCALDIQGLHLGPRVPPLLQPHRAAGPAHQAGLHRG